MDIRQWLKETRRAPESPPLDTPHSLRHVQSTKRPSPRRKRKDVPLDSSLLGRERDNTLLEETNGATPTASSTSSESSSSQSEAQSEHFEKRPRCKTREDLYEPHSGARKRRSKQKDSTKKGSKTKYRKSQKLARNINPGRTLVQNFNADNVPKSRLTLNPGISLGVFQKGKSSLSAPVPDLVFSEMRFLNDPDKGLREHDDHAAARPEDIRNVKKSKKRKVNPQEDEISQYFGVTKRLAQPNHHKGALLVDDAFKSREINTEDASHVAGSTRSLKQASNAVEFSPVMLPETPFLEFGSRKARNHTASTTVQSTSEKPNTSTSSRFQPYTTAVEVGQLGVTRAQKITGSLTPRSRVLQTNVMDEVLDESSASINQEGNQSSVPQAKFDQGMLSRNTTQHKQSGKHMRREVVGLASTDIKTPSSLLTDLLKACDAAADNSVERDNSDLDKFDHLRNLSSHDALTEGIEFGYKQHEDDNRVVEPRETFHDYQMSNTDWKYAPMLNPALETSFAGDHARAAPDAEYHRDAYRHGYYDRLLDRDDLMGGEEVRGEIAHYYDDANDQEFEINILDGGLGELDVAREDSGIIGSYDPAQDIEEEESLGPVGFWRPNRLY